MSDFRLLIDGKPAKGASTLEVINPAAGRTLTAATPVCLIDLFGRC